jgi:hypothetical protein
MSSRRAQIPHAGAAEDDAGRDQRERLRHHHGHDAGSYGAERHPNANLASALCDDVGHQAKDSNFGYITTPSTPNEPSINMVRRRCADWRAMSSSSVAV